jgi:hypothetical protein
VRFIIFKFLMEFRLFDFGLSLVGFCLMGWFQGLCFHYAWANFNGFPKWLPLSGLFLRDLWFYLMCYRFWSFAVNLAKNWGNFHSPIFYYNLIDLVCRLFSLCWRLIFAINILYYWENFMVCLAIFIVIFGFFVK